MTNEMKRPDYKECEGVLVPGSFSPDAVRSAINYKPKQGDLFIVTYPKCGTTWMQHIVMLILRRGRLFENAMNVMQNSPFLELTGADAIDMMTEPGPIKIHLPLPLAPYSPEAKYIYVARNPKDCCVSFYHHAKNNSSNNFSDATFSEFFEIFLKGEVEFGDYFDHLIPWYELRNNCNVYFLTYEDLKKDTEKEILKLARFIGEDYYKYLQEDPQFLKDILYYSSFEYMKSKQDADVDDPLNQKRQVPNEDRPLPSGMRYLMENKTKNPPKVKKPKHFNVRKGIIGDWKNYFTSEQEKRFKEYIAEKTANSDVMSLWQTIN